MIKQKEKIGKGGRKREYCVGTRGFKKAGKERKRKKRKRDRVKSQGHKKGRGDQGVIPGGKEASIAIISKRTILVISALGKSRDLSTNF